MEIETLRLLQKLQEKFRSKDTPSSGSFGKIVQKLLALSFHEMGFTDIVERGVQGADIDVTSESNNRFTIEVKTTEKLSVDLSSENVHALHSRTHDGYLPIIAVLRLAPFEDWILAKIPEDWIPAKIPSDKIPVRKIQIEKLRPYRMKSLEDQLSPKFDFVVQKHFKNIWNRGEQYLKGCLIEIGIRAED